MAQIKSAIHRENGSQMSIYKSQVIQKLRLQIVKIIFYDYDCALYQATLFIWCKSIGFVTLRAVQCTYKCVPALTL